MILAEPSPSQGDLHFSLLGFPVRINPWFWLVSAFLASSRDPVRVGLWILAVLLCILLHELGHAIAMRAYGYRPSIVLYSFGGLAIPHPGSYGIRRPGPRGDMLISFAGPASGFLLAAALVLPVYCLAILYPHDYGLAFYFRVVPVVFVPNHFLTQFLQDVLQISVMWGLVNLLPIYPLDGGQIAQQVFVLSSPGDAIRQSLILSVIVGGAMIAIFLAQAMNGTESPQWQSFYPAVFFAFLTYSNFTALQSYRGGWR